MALTVVALDPYENFIKFLDPELIDFTETHEYGGLRTVNVTYKFIDLVEEKVDLELFRLGNKLWVSGHNHIKDCLFVINTDVKEDVFKENSFTFTAEEVLVELNNAPLFSHTELNDSCFHIVNTNGKQEVRVDWNSLDYWFGDYFNIGVVQDCLNQYAQRISLTGTMSRMSLLRQIEEETGNVFVTRYEKDLLNNTIHRYLDFLNPNNLSKNWTLNLLYHFCNQQTINVPSDKAWEINPFEMEFTEENDGRITETQLYEKPSTYDGLDDDINDELRKDYTPLANLTPENCVFRITNSDGELLNSDGEVYSSGDEADALSWSASDNVNFNFNNNDASKTVLISLVKKGKNIGIDVNNVSYAVIDTVGVSSHGYFEKLATTRNPSDPDNTPMSLAYQDADFIENEKLVIHDDSYFEIYDHVHGKVLFRTCLNISIGHVHTEVLNYGFNLENVTHEVDETNTYNAVSPVLSLNDNSGNSNGITRTELADIITRWKNLEIRKGEPIPMIVQKITQKARTLDAAKEIFGDYSVDNSGVKSNQSKNRANWWCRPYHPQDNKDESTPANSTWEFWRGTAYWKAPYNKNKGELHITTDKAYTTQYQNIITRPDARNERRHTTPKMGFTESSDEDLFAIYNQVANYLREHENPKIDITVDVANLRNKTYNNYQLHDKVYIKLPDSKNLITARVTKTTKQAHDIAKNTVELSNYTELNTIKTLQHETIIHASNTTFKYPASATLTVTLENLEYDAEDEYSVQYPANKLITFTLYEITDGNRTFKNVYSKRTVVGGIAKLPMKYDPGKYEMDIYYGGDEEYEEYSSTIKITVGGKKEVKKATKKTKSKKTTKKTTVKKTTYYDKYGRSPDKKRVCAIGRISASGDQGSYADFFEMEFKNKCPKCGQEGTLFYAIFFAGNETSNWGRVPLTGNWEGGSAEGHVFCENGKCDGDWSCQGHEHGYDNTSLTVTRGRKKVDKSEAYKLREGKKVYQSVNKTQDTGSGKNKERKVKVKNLSKKVRQTALSIVGNTTGYSALRRICNWMDDNINYVGYSGFIRDPDRVISSKGGNCCDQTWTLLELCDAAGLTEYMELRYRHVYNHVYAVIKFRSSGNTVTVDCASDSYGCYGYVCQDYRTATLHETVYPTKPF